MSMIQFIRNLVMAQKTNRRLIRLEKDISELLIADDLVEISNGQAVSGTGPVKHLSSWPNDENGRLQKLKHELRQALGVPSWVRL